jgi:hypothetical protein
MNPSSRQTFAARSSAVGAAGVIAALLMVAGNGWTATPSSFSESRGYQTCVDAAERESHIVKVASDYFIYDHQDARRFYLNGYAFRDGASVPVKISCDTTLSGHRLLDVSVDAGQYAGRLVEPVEVARN